MELEHFSLFGSLAGVCFVITSLSVSYNHFVIAHCSLQHLLHQYQVFLKRGNVLIRVYMCVSVFVCGCRRKSHAIPDQQRSSSLGQISCLPELQNSRTHSGSLHRTVCHDKSNIHPVKFIISLPQPGVLCVLSSQQNDHLPSYLNQNNGSYFKLLFSHPSHRAVSSILFEDNLPPQISPLLMHPL